MVEFERLRACPVQKNPVYVGTGVDIRVAEWRPAEKTDHDCSGCVYWNGSCSHTPEKEAEVDKEMNDIIKKHQERYEKGSANRKRRVHR